MLPGYSLKQVRYMVSMLRRHMCCSMCVVQAAKAGNLAYVKALLLQGQDPNVTDHTGQYTPIIAAAFLGHIQVHISKNDVVVYKYELSCLDGIFLSA